MTGVRSAANIGERNHGSSASGEEAASLRAVGEGGYGRSSAEQRGDRGSDGHRGGVRTAVGPRADEATGTGPARSAIESNERSASGVSTSGDSGTSDVTACCPLGAQPSIDVLPILANTYSFDVSSGMSSPP
jgi:hypothetical protein